MRRAYAIKGGAMNKITGKQINPHLALRCIEVLALILMSGSMNASAQIDTVQVPSDIPPGEGNLNKAVETAVAAGTLSETVFQLEPKGYYILTGTITVPAGEHLTIVAPEPGKNQDKAPPQIIWSSAGNVNTRCNFDCYGDITLKNVWLLYANTNGSQVQSSLQIQDDPAANESGKGEVGLFEGVIFDYSCCPANASGVVGVTAKHFKGTFKNCYWKNCVDRHFSYYGRAVSFPFGTNGWHGDSLTFKNCTFANIGYVLMQEGGEYHDYVKFNHCTFLNVVMFSLESGWWWKLAVTNSIFVNTHMFGDCPAWRFYSSYDEPYGGTLKIDSVSTFGFSVPFIDQDRRILFTNSSYHLEKWLRDWMWNNPYSIWIRKQGLIDEIPQPQPMLSQGTLRFFDSTDSQGKKVFPYMNRVNLYDSTDPGFFIPPSDTGSMKTFLYDRWYNGLDTMWAWKPRNSLNRLWPLEENLAYKNDTVKTAGMGGFPLGDLYHWWPEKYQQWKAQEGSENARISTWLETGRDSGPAALKDPPDGTMFSGFALGQNYPNPFNPSTRIRYSVPETGLVSLKVYSLLGKEIATLFEGVRHAGDHVALFDGRSVAGGVYFVRLKAGHFSETKKMVLLK